MTLSDYYERERPRVLELIPRTASRILDVGCGSGWLGEQLKHRQGATVWGVEVVPEVAERAAQRLDRVWNASIEQALPEMASETFDCIVTADVLEHLIDPWTVLTDLRRKLVPGGTMVASIPNVGHWDVIRSLLEGRWQYTGEGLLDRTHLRFFTRRSIYELFWSAELAIREMTVIPHGRGVPQDLVAGLRKAGLRVADLSEQGRVFQYLVVAESRERPQVWPRVGIIVLKSGDEEEAIRCLESIERLAYAPVDTVVVDNGSTDGSRDAIRGRFPKVALLETGLGSGYLAAKNLGIRYALDQGAEYLLVLSSDTLPDPSLLARLVETAVLSPEAGLWSPRIGHDEGVDTAWATGLKWDEEELNFVVLDDGPGKTGSARVVDSLLGPAMLIRRDVFESVGTFASEYCPEWGDIDFCTRAIKMGFLCMVLPATLIRHKPGVLTAGGRSLVSEYVDTRNRLLWGLRHLRRRQRRELRRQILRETMAMLPEYPGLLAGTRKLYWWALKARQELRNPFIRVRLRALFDHLMRRSADCPQAVHRLVRPAHPNAATSKV